MRCLPRSLLLLFVLLVSAASIVRMHAQDRPPNAQQRPSSTPYTGDLSIFDKPGRDDRMQIGRVMDLLGLKPGVSVADIGAGSGWFTVRAARRIAPGGTVYAEDINPEAVGHIKDRAAKEGLSNVKVIQGLVDDPKIPANSVDAVLLLKVYHEVANPRELMRKLRPALRPGARVGIVDRNGDGTDHGLDAPVVLREMKDAGFRLSSRYDFTKTDGQDYFLIFVANP